MWAEIKKMLNALCWNNLKAYGDVVDAVRRVGRVSGRVRLFHNANVSTLLDGSDDVTGVAEQRFTTRAMIQR